jgi:hypothetical protein
MVNRIIFSIVVSAVVASIAFGQMKYSRSRSASITPTPTPTPLSLIPAQKTPPAPPFQKPTPAPRIMAAPSPARSTPVPRMTSVPAQAKSMQSPVPSQRMMSTAMQRKPVATPAPIPVKPTPTPVPPPDTKAYLDRQVASSKDQKFHMTINGKDLPMTPFHVWRQKEAGPNMTSTCVDMRGDDGRVYDIDFVTTGAQVSGIRIHKINGEALR